MMKIFEQNASGKIPIVKSAGAAADRGYAIPDIPREDVMNLYDALQKMNW